MKKPLKIPEFKNEDEERKFWWRLDIKANSVDVPYQSLIKLYIQKGLTSAP